MVFDFIDTSTKVSLVRLLRQILKGKLNVSGIVAQVNLPDFFTNQNDEEKVLTLIGIGVITPVMDLVNGITPRLQLNLKTKYHPPSWTTNPKYVSRLKNHIDFLLQATQQADESQTPSAISKCVTAFRHEYCVNSNPLGSMPTMESDMLLLKNPTIEPNQILRRLINARRKNLPSGSG